MRSRRSERSPALDRLNDRATTAGTRYLRQDRSPERLLGVQRQLGSALTADLLHGLIRRQASAAAPAGASPAPRREEQPFDWARQGAAKRLLDVEAIRKLDTEHAMAVVRAIPLPNDLAPGALEAREESRGADDVLVFVSRSADGKREEYLRVKAQGLLAVQVVETPAKGRPIVKRTQFFDAGGKEATLEKDQGRQQEAFEHAEIAERVKTSASPVVGNLRVEDMPARIRVEDWDQWSSTGAAAKVAPVFVEFLQAVIAGTEEKIAYIPSPKTRDPKYAKKWDDTRAWLRANVDRWKAREVAQAQADLQRTFTSPPAQWAAEARAENVQVDVQALAKQLAADSRDALCCVIAYYLYLTFTGRESRSFGDFYAQESRKGIIALSKSGALNFAYGADAWRGDMPPPELGKKEKDLFVAPVTHEQVERLWDSGARLAISYQDFSGKGQPHHFLLIMRIGRRDEWVNMDHTSTDPKRRYGPVEWDRVYSLVFDDKAAVQEKAQEAARGLPPEQGRMIEGAANERAP